jgi:hypothetical protein
VLTAQPDAGEWLRRAAESTYGNEIVALIVERAQTLHDTRHELLGAIAERFADTGCTYQAQRTETFLTPQRTPASEHGARSGMSSPRVTPPHWRRPRR